MEAKCLRFFKRSTVNLKRIAYDSCARFTDQHDARLFAKIAEQRFGISCEVRPVNTEGGCIWCVVLLLDLSDRLLHSNQRLLAAGFLREAGVAIKSSQNYLNSLRSSVYFKSSLQ